MIIIQKWVILCSFILWSAQALEWYPGEDGKIKWTNNCDFNGGDIGSERSRGDECGRLCFRRTECTRFTWTNHDGGTCWFKKGKAAGAEAFFSGHGGACGFVVGERHIMVRS